MPTPGFESSLGSPDIGKLLLPYVAVARRLFSEEPSLKLL